MKTSTSIVISVCEDADTHGDFNVDNGGRDYAATWIGGALLICYSREQLVVLRDLCNTQLEEWKEGTTP